MRAGCALTLVACGDSNPASPSSPSSSVGSVTVEGLLLGQGSAVTSSANVSASSNDNPITVVIEGTDISAIISADGTFKFEGLAPGEVTLIFLQNGNEIGRITLNAEDGTTVDITVKLEDSSIVLVKIEVEDDDDGDDDGEISITCAGEDIEIPAGQLPPPGECKIWAPQLPAGQQGPPGDCDELVEDHPMGTCVIDHYGTVRD